MDINRKQYKVVFTNEAINEMDNIYNYISNKLYSLISAKNLMKRVESHIKDLEQMPRMNKMIKKYSELDLEYRRIVIKNYVIIYNISEIEKTVYIMHMYYSKSNYFNRF